MRDTDLLIQKLGTESVVFERLLKKEIEVSTFLERHAPRWKEYLSEHAELDKFLCETLPRMSVTNIAKALQAISEAASNCLLNRQRRSLLE
jgi:hypothetical protein